MFDSELGRYDRVCCTRVDVRRGWVRRGFGCWETGRGTCARGWMDGWMDGRDAMYRRSRFVSILTERASFIGDYEKRRLGVVARESPTRL
jgi:hypothetical protein